MLVGPMQVGGYKIVFQADAPDPRRIPPQDLIGVTVILLSCFYKEREFIRIGYYVSSEVRVAGALLAGVPSLSRARAPSLIVHTLARPRPAR